MEDINKLIRDKQDNDFIKAAKKAVENIAEGDSTSFVCTSCSGKAVAYKSEKGEIWAGCNKCHKTYL